ncbi:MAG: protease B nonderepressible form [Caeruleum heppii]|nr:MAG: protease B nonderepressible form [Caeruleum heppii]
MFYSRAIPDLDNRVSSPARWQYYQLLESLEGFVEYLDQTVCAAPNNECHGRASSSLNATQIDLDYDAVSKIFIFTAFWHIGPDQGLWHETIRRSNPRDKLEVGILANEKATEAEELSLGGLVMVVGEDDHPKPTLFSFPSRHHSMPSSPSSSYTVSLPPPTGLHPSLRLTFPSPPRSPPAPHCALHTHAVLPSSLFLDKYQLSDPLFLASKNLLAVRSILGETDLEAPDWVVEKWGSSLLAEIAMPDVGHSGAWEVDIPLHLRYLRPNAGRNGVAEVQIPWPVVFWACQAPDGLKMTVNPFDRQHLGYDVLFRPRTMFYHLNPLPTSQSLIESIRVPVLDLDGAKWVEAGTVVSVVLGFVWICWTLWRVVLKSPDGIHYWGPAKEGKKRQ